MAEEDEVGEPPPAAEIEEVHDEGVVRFGVGDPDHLHSSVWRLWATKKGDIYVGVRSILGTIKISLHASGSWHIALTSEYAEDQEIEPESRFWDKWVRPEEFGAGVTLALQIYFPTSELRRFPVSSKSPMEWVEPAPEDDAVEIDLAIQGVDQAELQKWPGRSARTRPLGIIGRVGEGRDEILWLLCREVPFPDDLREELEGHKERILAEDDSPRQEMDQPRGFFWGQREDSRFVVEYAFD